MKCQCYLGEYRELWSLPSWERGLKLNPGNYYPWKGQVAPFVGAWIEIGKRVRRRRLHCVAPFVGAWIEMISTRTETCQKPVAPFVGAWIEILLRLYKRKVSCVAPFVGAWIEISAKIDEKLQHQVAPFVGAWIEMLRRVRSFLCRMSLPSWERGLK